MNQADFGFAEMSTVQVHVQQGYMSLQVLSRLCSDCIKCLNKK